jgi:hypothetical protein
MSLQSSSTTIPDDEVDLLTTVPLVKLGGGVCSCALLVCLSSTQDCGVGACIARCASSVAQASDAHFARVRVCCGAVLGVWSDQSLCLRGMRGLRRACSLPQLFPSAHFYSGTSRLLLVFLELILPFPFSFCLFFFFFALFVLVSLLLLLLSSNSASSLIGYR